MLSDLKTFFALIIAELICILLIIFIKKKISKSQLKTAFLCLNSTMLFICTSVLLQDILSIPLNIDPIRFENIIYIGTCFLPLSLLFTSLVFAKTRIEFKKTYLLLLIVPIISLIVLWTNDFHHLFYEKYSVNLNDTIYGPYMTVHSIYSYTLLLVGLVYLISYSIKNAGFFSRQSILIILGCLFPITVNVLGTLRIIPMTIYLTPISFTIAIMFFALAIFKFKFLSTTPIALQRIVDRISDSYIILDENNNITDFNKTFLTTFKLKENELRNLNIKDLLELNNVDSSKLLEDISKARESDKTFSFEYHFTSINKYFNIEITSIFSNNSIIGIIILFKDITQHIEDMKKIKDTQESLMEAERLSSLGQLIGGIAHNLKTPIMSIAGAAEGLTDLVKEYDSSIGDPEVNEQDHHDIAKDMFTWIKKIKSYTEYMSDVITAVKGQAVTLSETENVSFDLDELVKRVDILMKHELKNAVIYLNVDMRVDSSLTIHGDVNSLVQVINNMISNAIQAYKGKQEQNIDMILEKKDNNLLISIQDYASGLPEKVQKKLFKEMVTTKGKNGTGLGLYMSYSTIKAHFNGNIEFKTKQGEGTTFTITIPI